MEMSSLDDTFERLRFFYTALAEFDEALRVSLDDIKDRHGTIDALWQDNASRAYRAVYEPLVAVTDRYVVHEASRFEEYISQKIHELDDYLHRY